MVVEGPTSHEDDGKLGEEEGPGGDAADGEEMGNQPGATADTAINIV